MGEGGGTGNVEKMRCPMYRNVQDGLRSKVRFIRINEYINYVIFVIDDESQHQDFEGSDLTVCIEKNAS